MIKENFMFNGMITTNNKKALTAIDVRTKHTNSIPGLHNIQPAGHLRPAEAFLAARESFRAVSIVEMLPQLNLE